MNCKESLKNYITRLNKAGLLRSRSLSTTAQLCFDSNDYLSLARHKANLQAYQKGYRLYPSGSAGSMFLNGYHPNHKALERAFAEWLGVEDCILFSCGYAANLAVTGLVADLKVNCLIDKGVHASIYDGLKLSKVPYKRYLHQNLQDAISKIKTAHPSILITEGIFSMSGQISSLSEIASLCKTHQMELLVDEAHSIGILGEHGRGAVVYHGLTQNEVPLRVIPLGKAFAGQGAIVAGEKIWIEALIQAARSLIYSTAISPALSFGLLKTLELVSQSDDRRVKLQELIHCFRVGIKDSPLKWIDSFSPIQQMQLGCPHLALLYSQELEKQGIRCAAVRQPTVTLQATGLRVILNYQHKSKDISRLFDCLLRIHDALSH